MTTFFLQLTLDLLHPLRLCGIDPAMKGSFVARRVQQKGPPVVGSPL
jgi:hypothetical protein